MELETLEGDYRDGDFPKRDIFQGRVSELEKRHMELMEWQRVDAGRRPALRADVASNLGAVQNRLARLPELHDEERFERRVAFEKEIQALRLQLQGSISASRVTASRRFGEMVQQFEAGAHRVLAAWKQTGLGAKVDAEQQAS